jgi:predicted esterase YcpF (UPF0227 family)
VTEALPVQQTPGTGASDRLARLRSYQDLKGGFCEEFLKNPVGPEASWAILTLPLQRAARGACLVCSSFGPEAGTHRRLELLTAHALAQHGFATLRIRRGERAPEPAMDVKTRLAELTAAVDVLAERELPLSGLIGVGFGGTMAGHAAQELTPEAVAVVEPIVRGNQFLEESLQRHAVVELMTAAEIARERRTRADKPKSELAARGVTTVRGYRLTRADADQMAAIDLVEDLGGYRGRVLVVSISAAGTAPETVVQVVERRKQGGAQTALEIVQEALPMPFGEYYFTGTPPSKVDTRFWLDRRLADLVAVWLAETGSEGPE